MRLFLAIKLENEMKNNVHEYAKILRRNVSSGVFTGKKITTSP